MENGEPLQCGKVQACEVGCCYRASTSGPLWAKGLLRKMVCHWMIIEADVRAVARVL